MAQHRSPLRPPAPSSAQSTVKRSVPFRGSDLLSRLPPDACRAIFALLPPVDQRRSRLVCRAWRHLVIPDKLIFHVSTADTPEDFRRVFAAFPRTRSIVVICDGWGEQLVRLASVLPVDAALHIDSLSVRSESVSGVMEQNMSNVFLPWVAPLTQLTSLSLSPITHSALYRNTTVADHFIALQALTRLDLCNVQAAEADRVLSALPGSLLQLAIAAHSEERGKPFPLPGLGRHTQLRSLDLDLQYQPLAESVFTAILAMTRLGALRVCCAMRRSWTQCWFAAMPHLEDLDLDIADKFTPHDGAPESLIPDKLHRLRLSARNAISSEELLRLTDLRHLFLRFGSVTSWSFVADSARLALLANLEHMELYQPELPVSGFAALTVLRRLRSLALPYTCQGSSPDRGYPSIGLLTLLTSLSVTNADCVTDVIPHWSSLVGLEDLSLTGCRKLEDLPGLSTLTALRHLLLNQCPACSPVTFATVSHLTALETLLVGNGTKHLSWSDVLLPALLRLTRLRRLEFDTPDPASFDPSPVARGLTLLTQLMTWTTGTGHGVGYAALRRLRLQPTDRKEGR